MAMFAHSLDLSSEKSNEFHYFSCVRINDDDDDDDDAARITTSYDSDSRRVRSVLIVFARWR